MDGRCGSRPEINEDKAVDRDDERQREMETEEDAKAHSGLQGREEGRKDYIMLLDKQFQKVTYTNIIQIVNEM